MALSVAALESLKAALAACASVQAVACFGAEDAAAGLRMANELRAIFLPLSRVQNKTGTTASGLPGSLPPRRLRGGAKRVAVSSAAGRAPAHASRAGDHPSLAFGTPNSAFRRPPLRLAMSAEAPIRSVSLRAWITFSPSKAAVPVTPGVAHKEVDSPPAASGRVVRLVQARASTAQRAETGSDLVVTPARRSTRGESKFSPSHQSGRNSAGRTHALLRETNYAYAPNDALLDSAKKGRSISA